MSKYNIFHVEEVTDLQALRNVAEKHSVESTVTLHMHPYNVPCNDKEHEEYGEKENA